MTDSDRVLTAALNPEWLSLALDQVSSQVCIKDRDARYLYANQSALQRLGCHASALSGKQDEQFVAPAEAARRRSADLQALSGQRSVETVALSDPQGAQRWVQEVRVPLRASGAAPGSPPVAVLVVLEDLGARAQPLPEDGQPALFDILTGLPNRDLLFERISQAQQRSRRSGSFGALLCLELDQLEDVSGQHGRAAAERLLLETSRRLGEAVRAVDTVARIGLSEFVVLAESVGLDQSQGIDFSAELKRRIERQFDEGCSFGGLSLDFSARMGSVLFRGNEPAAPTLLATAIEVMHQQQRPS